jgi:hypothetical protein
VQYLGIDWGTRKAAWCALDERGELVEGTMAADEDGLVRLVHTLGIEVRGCIEMMSGAGSDRRRRVPRRASIKTPMTSSTWPSDRGSPPLNRPAILIDGLDLRGEAPWRR